MFAPHCHVCDRRVLLGHDRITHLRRAAGRHKVGLRCRCGTRLEWVGGAAVQR